MKYAHYTTDTGKIVGYYDDQIHAAIPEPKIILTDEQWQDCINNPGLRRVDPAAGAIVAYTPPPQPLANYQAAANKDIDAAAGRARARYITVSDGQEAVYVIKERQARDYKAAGYPTTVPPMVQAEADALGITPTEAADAIIAKADQWIQLAADIEKARRGGKAAVDACTAVDPNNPTADEIAAVETARDQAISMLDAI